MNSVSLEVKNIVKVYPARKGWFRQASPAVRAVDGLSFQVPRGAIFGLLGPNGAGKTTLLKIMCTLRQQTSGQVLIQGLDTLAEPLAVRRCISLVLQETAVELFLSVRDNFLTYARFHGIETGEARRRADHVMDLFDLRTEADRKVQDLSGGYKRRVQVAKVFLTQTPVLFLDEFSTGMDPILKRSVLESLRKEAKRGRTIVLTTQILSEAEELCDDILILHKGKQLARGDLNQLKLLSQNVCDVLLTYETLPEGIEAELVRYQPSQLKVDGNTLEFTLKAAEAQALEAVSALARKGRVLRVEIGGASLEEIFVQLTQKATGKRPE